MRLLIIGFEVIGATIARNENDFEVFARFLKFFVKSLKTHPTKSVINKKNANLELRRKRAARRAPVRREVKCDDLSIEMVFGAHRFAAAGHNLDTFHFVCHFS